MNRSKSTASHLDFDGRLFYVKIIFCMVNADQIVSTVMQKLLVDTQILLTF